MSKRIKDFTCELVRQTSWCDMWKASGFIDGEYYTVEKGFLFYSDSKIKKMMRAELREKASGFIC